MRVVALMLLVANLVAGAYVLFGSPSRPVPVDVRSLELNADRIRQVREGAPSDAPAGVQSAAACLTWGPLAAAELPRAREELEQLGIADPRVRAAPDTLVWWVHLPPARSRDEAERRVRELEQLGVRDARVVTEDGWRNAVSLGIFRSQDAANAHQARMREIKVRNTAIVSRSDLVRFSTIEIAEPAPELAARMVEMAAGFAGSEVKAAACAAQAR
jgi:hypothetical protein